jgi:hypothetical protein
MELLFVPEFHTGILQYTLYPFIFFHFSEVYPFFAFEKYTGASKFPFQALAISKLVLGSEAQLVNRNIRVRTILQNMMGHTPSMK